MQKRREPSPLARILYDLERKLHQREKQKQGGK